MGKSLGFPWENHWKCFFGWNFMHFFWNIIGVVWWEFMGTSRGNFMVVEWDFPWENYRTRLGGCSGHGLPEGTKIPILWFRRVLARKNFHVCPWSNVIVQIHSWFQGVRQERHRFLECKEKLSSSQMEKAPLRLAVLFLICSDREWWEWESETLKNWVPGLVNIQKAIESDHWNSGFTH